MSSVRNQKHLDCKDKFDMDVNLQKITTKNAAQKHFLRAIESNEYDYVFGIGPCGTGKSLLAIYSAIKGLQEGRYKRIVFVRANVFVKDEMDVGAIPGTLEDKYAPHFAPMLDNLREIGVTKTYVARLIEADLLELLPVQWTRGRSFNDTIVILDEAQNCTPSQMITVMSRLGRDSKLIVIGDPDQIDRNMSENEENGLQFAASRLENVSSVYIQYFTRADIVRNKNLSEVIALLQASWNHGRISEGS
jgi:phosphate starvation-inducible PhoH-like protein